MTHLLGIDIGTSSCKVIAFYTDGTVAASASREYPVYYPHPGWAEQDPNEWYAAICACTREICGKIDPAEIKAIGIAGQGWSCIPVDKAGNALANTPIWFDTRAAAECDWLKETIGEDALFEVCGNPIQPTYSTPKTLWFKAHEPDVYKNAYKFLQSNSYVAYRLAGTFTQDKSMSYGHYFYNVKTGEYDNGLIEQMGLESSHCPDIFDCHDIVGEVTPTASAETGLKAGTPVVIGGLDAACGTLGAGVYQPGQTQEQSGQAGGMSICEAAPAADRRLILGNHVVPGLWLLQGGTVGGGGVMKWFFEQFGTSFGGSFKDIDEAAAAVPPGSGGLVFLPYMNGERSPIWNPNAKGVYFGLDFSKTRAHMARAAMEGVAFALRHNLDVAEQTGAKVDKLRASGGAANSDVWMQIKADVTGKVIEIPDTANATGLGAAILAGVGTGVYRDFEEAVGKTVSIKKTFYPQKHEEYEENYSKYLKLYENLKDLM